MIKMRVGIQKQWTGKTEVLEDKPVSMPFCLSWSHIDWPWIEPGPARWVGKLKEAEWAFNVTDISFATFTWPISNFCCILQVWPLKLAMSGRSWPVLCFRESHGPNCSVGSDGGSACVRIPEYFSPFQTDMNQPKKRAATEVVTWLSHSCE